MRIAVTGSTGMIGVALINAALHNEDEVIAIVRPGSKRVHNIPNSDNIKVIECSVSDYGSIEGAERCDMFFHLAWDKTFGPGRDDADAQSVNIKYTVDAVHLANSWGAEVFVGAGSQAEYGPIDTKINGSTPAVPQSGYGVAKFAAGKLSAMLCKELEMRFCWARILSAYGELDADHTLISYLIRTLIDGGTPELTPCEQMWDYIYSKDVAKALLSIGSRGKDGRTYCIGSGECRPLSEYVKIIRDQIDPKLSISFGSKEYYPHQPMYLCADISELTEDTGFVPEYDFERGVAETIRYVRSQINKPESS